ncbi:MAG: thioredoxin fold domain-containing protein [Calditrichaeota bacterium]|nr:thioredoxin fold domain-containing protein [Calditrichota bacterium]MCB9367093.1 thioredoxin fold domain-containing protein [Calditrichota bacterium]
MGLIEKLFGGSHTVKPLETSDATFEADVMNSELPVMLDLWSPTCMPCKVLGGMLRELAPEYDGKVKIMKLDVSQNMQTAMRFRIRGVPTVLFFKKGKMVDQLVGLAPMDTLRERLDRLAA